MAQARPIVLVPGIKGTKLVQTNRVDHDVIFSGLQMQFESVMDLELTPAFNKRHYDRRPDTIIKPGELESVAYGEFIEEASEETPLFIFNYDWRLSLATNGARLRTFLEYLANKGKAINKVLKIDKRHEPVDFSGFNIVTHSMGNFIARNYLKNHGFDLVDRVCFVAPPFRGSLSLAEVVVTGQGLLSTTQAKIRKIIRTFPGALELLPHKPGYETASRFDDGADHDFFTLDHWQDNVSDQRKEWGKKFKDTLEAASHAVANELIELDTLPPSERKRILVIARHGGETMQAVTVRRQARNAWNYMDFKHGCRARFGDEEVAHISSCCFWDSVLTLMLTDKTGF
ncbi:MAG: esterase/lipase family protein, partial [Oceanidesulfovibrio sp.]